MRLSQWRSPLVTPKSPLAALVTCRRFAFHRNCWAKQFVARVFASLASKGRLSWQALAECSRMVEARLFCPVGCIAQAIYGFSATLS